MEPVEISNEDLLFSEEGSDLKIFVGTAEFPAHKASSLYFTRFLEKHILELFIASLKAIVFKKCPYLAGMHAEQVQGGHLPLGQTGLKSEGQATDELYILNMTKSQMKHVLEYIYTGKILIFFVNYRFLDINLVSRLILCRVIFI